MGISTPENFSSIIQFSLIQTNLDEGFCGTKKEISNEVDEMIEQ